MRSREATPNGNGSVENIVKGINWVVKHKDTYTVTSTITAKEFAEGGLEMSNNMADAEAQACIRDSKRRIQKK